MSANNSSYTASALQKQAYGSSTCSNSRCSICDSLPATDLSTGQCGISGMCRHHLMHVNSCPWPDGGKAAMVPEA